VPRAHTAPPIADRLLDGRRIRADLGSKPRAPRVQKASEIAARKMWVSSGSVECWGDDSAGQLGNGVSIIVLAPSAVTL